MAITSLQLTTAATAASVEIGNELIKLTDFATSFQGNAASEGTAIIVPVFAFASGAADFLAGTNDYQTGAEAGVTGAKVLLNDHLVKAVVYSDMDFMENSALGYWETSGKLIARYLAKGFIGKTLAKINKTAVTQESVFTAANAKAKDLVAQLTSTAETYDINVGEASLILTPTLFANVLSILDANVYGGTEAIRSGRIPGLFGFKSVMSTGQLSKTAAEKLNGAIVGGDALGLASRAVVVNSAKSYEEVGSMIDDKTNVAITFRRSVNFATGQNYMAGEILAGSKLLNAGKVVRLVSAATAEDPVTP